MRRIFQFFAGAFAVLVLTCASAQAQYLGCFSSDAPNSLEVQTTSRVALTMCW